MIVKPYSIRARPSHRLLALTGLLVLLAASVVQQRSDIAQASQSPAGPAGAAVAGEMLVGYRPGVSDSERTAMHRRHGAQVLRRFPQIRVELIRLPAGESVAQGASGYRSEKGVAYAEPNYLLHASGTPNDQDFGQQWGLSNTGQAVPAPSGVTGLPGDDISAIRAWDIQTGSPNVTVAVIDTGVDTGHPDLAANIDTADAFNFIDNSNVVYDPNDVCGTGPNDDHGTHVSGILGAVGNNATGVSGVAWNVRILPLKFLGLQGSGPTAQCGVGDDANAIAAIFYAIAKGAQIINVSWGGESTPNESLRQAMIQAGQAGVLFSVAAGNAGINLSTGTDYPSSFNLSNEIVVAASDSTDKLALFSNYGGPTALAAPGTQILSTITRAHSVSSPYGYLDGTSMAAPFVSGALALLRSQYPSASPAELKSRLLSQVDVKANFGSGRTTSGGRLNVFHALTQALAVVPTIESPVGGELYGPGTPQTASWRTNIPAGNPTTPYRLEFTANALASTTYSENFTGNAVPANFTQPPDSDKPWILAPGAGPGGSNALRSGLVRADNNKESWVATTVRNAVPGTVSFSYSVSSENCASQANPVCGDFFQFFIDGNSLLLANGVAGFKAVSFPISAGVHTLSWSYEKDATCPDPSTNPSCTPFQSLADAAWIAGLSVTGIDAAQWATVATTPAGATSATWMVPMQPTRSAELRVCQDTGSACSAAAASATPGVFTIRLVLVQPEALSVTEGGPAATYSVSLVNPPAATVTINLSPDPQLKLSTNSLVFTAANAPQTVSVSAPDDLVAQPSPHAVTIQQAVASADPAYNGLSIPVTVAISDIDAPGVAVNDGGGITLVPGGGPGSYSVVLTSKPLSPVTVMTAPDTPLVTVPSSLTFDASNWSVPQNVAVGMAAGGPSIARNANVANRATSADPAYNGLASNPARVHILASGASGYWLVASDGGIFSFGSAHFLGSTGSIHLNKPIVAAMATPSGAGYWLVASDGGIFSFGDAGFLGSTGSIHLNQPIVAAMATPSGGGYWLVASDGGIFSFGDARFFGSTGSIHLNKPIVAAVATPSGAGYWLVASDGGIFSFGDARFVGSTGSIHLNKPIVAALATPSGGGYWLVASDGGIFAFGDSSFFGSTGAIHLNQPIVAAIGTPSGAGYLLVASDGGIFAFGDSTFFGSTGSIHLNQPIVAALGR